MSQGRVPICPRDGLVHARHHLSQNVYVDFRKIRAPIKIKSALPPPPKTQNTPPSKTRNFMDMGFSCRKNAFFQASIKLTHPFPAPELRTKILRTRGFFWWLFLLAQILRRRFESKVCTFPEGMLLRVKRSLTLQCGKFFAYSCFFAYSPIRFSDTHSSVVGKEASIVSKQAAAVSKKVPIVSKMTPEEIVSKEGFEKLD